MKIQSLYTKVILALLVGQCVFLLFGCGHKTVTRNDVAGNYRLTYDLGTSTLGVEHLVLHRNGTYKQTYTYSGRSITNSGKWSIDNSTGFAKLVLCGALDPVDRSLGPPRVSHPVKKRDRWIPVERNMGRVYLEEDSDLGWFYERMP